MRRKQSRLFWYVILLAVFSLLPGACSPASQPNARKIPPVTQAPAQAPAQPAVVKTVEVQKEGSSVATATQAPAQPAATVAPAAPAATEAPAVTEAPAAAEAPPATATTGQARTEAPAPAGPATLAPADSSAAPLETAPPAGGVQPGKFEATPSPIPSTATAQPTLAPTGSQENLQPFTPVTLVPAAPTLAATEEARLVQVEWPTTIRLGDSDLIRLTLIPASQGYTLVTEYPEHTTITQTVTVPHPPGYEMHAVARLDAVGFQMSPEGEQDQLVPPDQRVEWRWSLTPRQSGRQRLSLALWLRWVPVSVAGGATGGGRREVSLYNRSLEVRVVSFLGMTQSQALLTGLFTLLLGGGLGAFSLTARPRPRRALPRLLTPGANLDLAIELPPRAAAPLYLSPAERRLLQTLFNRYSRLVIEQEFLSGYSGARAFLARPILPDGRADAYTIAKLGEREAIRQEFANYEAYVKDTLPPITARIQHPPVAVRAGGHGTGKAEEAGRSIDPAASGRLAAIQYTFIGQAGQAPLSLRQALLENPDPGLLYKLLDTFGPNWWLQRRPYTFRLAQEYDRLLPAHFVVTPLEGGEKAGASRTSFVLDGRMPPGDLSLSVGDVVTLRHLQVVEQRLGSAPGEERLSLAGQPPAGHPALRARWLSTLAPEGALGRISATRHTLLTSLAGDACQQAQQMGLPDPLARLPALLAETVTGSQSTIHGDLNLENILIGPGGLVWLIDFAQTRDGHTLLDFAHLAEELITHILAPQVSTPQDYLALLAGHNRQPENTDGGDQPGLARSSRAPGSQTLRPLLEAVQEMAGKCLFNPFQPGEFDLALTLACLGALKYANLNAHQRCLLYVTAAYQIQKMEGK